MLSSVIPFQIKRAARDRDRLALPCADDSAFPPAQPCLSRRDDILYMSAEGLDSDSATLARHILENHPMRFALRTDPTPMNWNNTDEL